MKGLHIYLNIDRSLVWTVIQFAKLSGFSPIITTASTQHETLLKSLGATHIIDRHRPLSELSDAVKAITSVPVKLGFDSVSTPETLAASYDVIAPGGKLIVALKMNFPEEKLVADKEIANVGGSVHVQRELGVELLKHLPALLVSGDIKVSIDRRLYAFTHQRIF